MGSAIFLEAQDFLSSSSEASNGTWAVTSETYADAVVYLPIIHDEQLCEQPQVWPIAIIANRKTLHLHKIPAGNHLLARSDLIQ